MTRILSRGFARILALVLLGIAPAVHAQSSTHTPYTQSDYYAVDYGQWGIKSQQANTYLFSPIGLCQANASGTSFFPFATNAPVLIADATAANSEVVTPTSVTNASNQCGFAAAPANNHFSFQIVSGTGGLQETLNALAVNQKTTALPARIILDRNWYGIAGAIPGSSSATILAAAKGNAHAFLTDTTTAGNTNYVWNGTAYAVGTWVNTKPTPAAGAAAGTGATITDAATALAPTVALTTGTATTTGTLFTLTYATTSQFQYAPTCTVATTGPNSFTAFTTATTFAGGAATVTVTATAAPLASVAYKFAVNCY